MKNIKNNTLIFMLFILFNLAMFTSKAGNFPPSPRTETIKSTEEFNRLTREDNNSVFFNEDENDMNFSILKPFINLVFDGNIVNNNVYLLLEGNGSTITNNGTFTTRDELLFDFDAEITNNGTLNISSDAFGLLTRMFIQYQNGGFKESDEELDQCEQDPNCETGFAESTFANNGTINYTGSILSVNSHIGTGTININGNLLLTYNAKIDGNGVNLSRGSVLDIGTSVAKLGNSNIDGTMVLHVIGSNNVGGKGYDGGQIQVTSGSTVNINESGNIFVLVRSSIFGKVGDSIDNVKLVDAGSGTINGLAEKILANQLFSIENGSTNGTYKITYKKSIEEFTRENTTNKSIMTITGIWEEFNDPAFILLRDSLVFLAQTNDVGDYLRMLLNLGPSDSQQILATNSEITNAINKQIMMRQDAQGRSGGDEDKYGLWAQGLYNFSKQKESSDSAGFEGNTFGIIIGGDYKFTDEISAGLGYNYSITKSKSLGRDTDINTHTVFLYGKWEKDNSYVRGNFNYGFGNYEEESLVKKADYGVHNISTEIASGYNFSNGLTPEFALQYSFVNQNDYEDSLGQNISADKLNVVTTKLSVRYAKDFNISKSTILTPTIKLGVLYDVYSENGRTYVNFVNTVYSLEGKKLEKFGGELAVGLEATMDSWEFLTNYNLNIRKDYLSHTVSAKAKFNF